MEQAVKVASREVIWVIPVNHTSSPLYGPLRLRCDTSRPQAKLDTTRCVGVMQNARGIVDEIRRLDGAGNVPINKESQCIGFPIDGEIVPIGKSVSQTRFGDTIGLLRDNALPKEVRLPLGGRITGELPVNFVLDTTHGDEGCNYTSPTTGLQPGSDTSIVHVTSRRE